MLNRKTYFIIIIALVIIGVTAITLSFIVSGDASDYFESSGVVMLFNIWLIHEIQYADKPNKFGINTVKASFLRQGKSKIYRIIISPLLAFAMLSSLKDLIKALILLAKS